MKYLRKFETEADVFKWQTSEDHVEPNVVLASDTGEVQYNVAAITGVFIQHVDGTLYTVDDWTAGGFTNDEANGVAVIDSRVRFVIAKEDIDSKMKWEHSSAAVSGVFTTTDSEEAKTDYSGFENTQYLSYGAGKSCKDFIFPNGALGYLPSVGEFAVVYEYLSEVQGALNQIGTAFKKDLYWSSTQNNYSRAWMIGLYSSFYLSESYKYDARFVRPFTTF